MGRNPTSTLVPFNSKVEPKVKATIDALVSTKAGGCKSVHELLKFMLQQFAEGNPEAYAKAQEFMEFMETPPQKMDNEE